MSGPGRQDPRGGPPVDTDGDDLLDLVYGELGGVDERSVRARVASDPSMAARLGDIERVRSLFSEMADEEPPPGLSAQLLAQAAQAAGPRARREAAESGGGFWARVRAWLSPIAAHPGLAAAASLLLVAGVTGVLVSRRGADFAEGERITSESSATADRALAGGEAPGTAAAGADQGESVGQAAVAPAPTGSVTADDPAPASTTAALDELADKGATTKADDVAADRKASRRAAREPAKPMPKAAAPKDFQAEAGDVARALRDDSRAGGGKAEPEPAAERSRADGDELAAEEPRAPTPNSPPAQSGPSGGGGAADSSPPPPQNQSAPASPAALHKRALDAASSKRCLEVQSIEKTVRGLDPTYYDKIFRPDRRLATCLSATKRAKRSK